MPFKQGFTIKKNKQFNVGICLAHNYPVFERYFMVSLWRMQFHFNEWIKKNGREDTLSLFINGGYQLDKMRNDVVKEAIDAGCDLLLFLDTDMSFPDNTIPRMIEVLEANPEFEAVSGLYTHKKPDYHPQIFIDFNEKKKKFHRLMAFPLDVPFEIVGAGAGILMVKKQVFKKKKPPYFKFVYEGQSKVLPEGMGEDLFFFWKFRPKTLCDPTIVCGHHDTRPVTIMNYINKNKLKVVKDKIVMTEAQKKKLKCKKK